mmetsp:Transcript_12031/g.36998  ORF Transcript_12031/g.36998 Transcript_12031/m.36998 type:complete len:267 (-) Transcript_12031:1067-1867(-)
MIGAVASISIALLKDCPKLVKLLLDVLDFRQPRERTAPIAARPLQAEIAQTQLPRRSISGNQTLFRSRDECDCSPRVPKIGAQSLDRQRLHHLLAYIACQLQVALYHHVLHYAFELCVREVLKHERVIQSETASKTWIGLSKHLLDLLLVADHHNCNVFTGCSMNEADELVYRQPTIVGMVEAVRLVDDEHLSFATLDQRFGLVGRVTLMAADEVARLFQLPSSIRQEANSSQDPAVQLPDGRLASPRIAEEHTIQWRNVIWRFAS